MINVFCGIILVILFVLLVFILFRQYNHVVRPLFFKAEFKSKYQKGDKMALVYAVSCGPAVDADVAERRLTVTVNEVVVSTKTYDSKTVNLGEFSFGEKDVVVLSLVDVDDVGNVSEPATVQFVATDTLPPATPGGFSVALVREE